MDHTPKVINRKTTTNIGNNAQKTFINTTDEPKRKKHHIKKKTQKSTASSSKSENESQNESHSPRKKTPNVIKDVIADNFVLLTLIGKGAFGQIILSYDMRDNNEVAIKKEIRQYNKPSQLRTEAKIYQSLLNITSQDISGMIALAQNDVIGVPRFYGMGEMPEYNYLIMEFLGPNLIELLSYCKTRKFTISTVCLIALQILNRIENLHKHHWIHRDIKPENFLIGNTTKSNVIYMIDFGLGKRYKNPKNHQHIPYREGRPLTGTARYVSINTHLGIEQSRRDDLESIGYVLVFFLKGSLPWQGIKAQGDKYIRIMEKKLQIPTEILCHGLPDEIMHYLNYCKSLRFEDRPDYDYLKGLFIKLLSKCNMNYGLTKDMLKFDWCYEDPQNSIWQVFCKKKGKDSNIKDESGKADCRSGINNLTDLITVTSVNSNGNNMTNKKLHGRQLTNIVEARTYNSKSNENNPNYDYDDEDDDDDDSGVSGNRNREQEVNDNKKENENVHESVNGDNVTPNPNNDNENDSEQSEDTIKQDFIGYIDQNQDNQELNAALKSERGKSSEDIDEYINKMINKMNQIDKTINLEEDNNNNINTMINAINKPNNSNKNILVVNNNNNNKDVVNKNESSNNSNTIATNNNNNDCDLSETPKNDNMPYIGNINDKQLTKQLNNATVSQNNIEINNNNNNNQNQNEEKQMINQTKHSHTIEESKPSLNKNNSLNMQNKKDKLQKTSSLIIRDNPNIKYNDNISDTSQNKNKKVCFQVEDKSPKIKHHPPLNADLSYKENAPSNSTQQTSNPKQSNKNNSSNKHKSFENEIMPQISNHNINKSKESTSSVQKINVSKENIIKINLEPMSKYYSILKDLGHGSYGQVKKVRHIKLCEDRAMKIVNKKSESSQNEIEILRKISHPNISNIFEIFEDSRKYYIMMEFLEGGELFDVIISQGSFSEVDAANIMKQLLNAVNYLHSKRIVHRDIKPENIMLTNKPVKGKFQIKLIDFGTAKIFEPNQLLTKFIGTSYYIAPEVLKESYNEKCDVWSCGVILYILLSGYPPFNGNSNVDIFHHIQNSQPIFIGEEWEDVTKEAIDLLKCMLNKNVSRRYSAEKCLKHKWFKTLLKSNELEKTSKNYKKIQINTINKMAHFVNENRLKKAVLQFISTQFNLKSEENELRELFKEIDTANRGQISKEEFRTQLMQLYGEDHGKEVADKIFVHLDMDGSGEISYDEFLSAMIDGKKIITEERLEKAFRIFDKDGNGRLSVQEIKEVFGGSEQTWKKIIEDIDLNKDGEVDFKEFKAMMMNIDKSLVLGSKMNVIEKQDSNQKNKNMEMKKSSKKTKTKK